jgi:hypothetical protein
LDECSDQQYAATQAFMGAEGESGQVLFPTDLALLSLATRSLDLVDAFNEVVDRWNLSVGSALVRLQVDNVLRAHLISTSPESGVLVNHMLGDEPLHRYRLPEQQRVCLPEGDQANARATDRNLRLLAAATLPWIDEVYETASKWIHHSEAHLLTTWRTHPVGDVMAISGRIPVDIDQFDEPFVMGMLGAMLRASDGLLEYLEGWAKSKPERIDATPDPAKEIGRLMRHDISEAE